MSRKYNTKKNNNIKKKKKNLFSVLFLSNQRFSFCVEILWFGFYCSKKNLSSLLSAVWHFVFSCCRSVKCSFSSVCFIVVAFLSACCVFSHRRSDDKWKELKIWFQTLRCVIALDLGKKCKTSLRRFRNRIGVTYSHVTPASVCVCLCLVSCCVLKDPLFLHEWS